MASHDIEMQPLRQADEPELSSHSSPRSSTDSDASLLLTRVNEEAQHSSDYADFQTEPQFLLLRPAKRVKKTFLLALGALLFILYTAWLLSYRSTPSSGRQRPKNNTTASSSLEEAPIKSSTSADLTSSSGPPILNDLLSSLGYRPSSSTSQPTSTKELVTLTEKPTRPDREQIPHIDHKLNMIESTVMFLGSHGESKSQDEGLYFEKHEGKYVVRKLSDPDYEEELFQGDEFTYNGVQQSISAVLPNGDATQLLILTHYEKLFRHSALANFYLYDVAAKEYTVIASESTSRLQHASWSKTFQYVSFVQDGDLFVFDTNSKRVERVTNDGTEDILNAKTDWVYEEEVLSADSALWWSDDDSRLAFLKFNETGVEELILEKFSDGVFPTLDKIKYPKPGQVNPRISLLTYDVENKKVSTVNRSDSTLGDEWICYGALFIGNSLIVRESDRVSRFMDYRLVKDGDSKIIYSIDSNDYNGWIDNFTGMVAVPKNETMGRDNDGFVDIVEFEGFNHIGFFSSLGVSTPVMLTSGEWEVLSIEFFDESLSLLFFTSNRQSHFEQHLFAVNVDSQELFSISDITTQGYHVPVFSPGGRFFYDYNEGPTFPLISLVDTSHFNTYPKRSVDFTGRRRSYHTVTLSDGQTVDLIEMVPEHFDPNKKHPVLVSVYGGPGFRKVNVVLHGGFEDDVADDLNAVILFIDPRGTGGQGWKYRSYAKHHIGHWEPRDITEVTKLWINSRTYIDEEKVVCWGWSYGGFTTLKTLEYDQGNVFKYGIAVAPVTDWMLYDSIYTERYMALPSDNVDGYKESRIADFGGFANVKRFAIMHGTGDDNVHIQNTFKLLDGLNLHSLTNFDLMVFPDSNHNINFHNAYGVLMTRMRAWLIDNVL